MVTERKRGQLSRYFDLAAENQDLFVLQRISKRLFFMGSSVLVGC
jgi:hypothetical protein